jgi:hypothetical protein
MRQVKRKVIPVLIETLKTRFIKYDDPIYSKMRWFSPELWSSDKEYGIQDISAMAAHFANPLSLVSFDLPKALREWKSFKVFVKTRYPKLPDANSLWKSVLSCRKDEFPHLCKLASLIISISGSNSSVERMSSVVTNILSDKRLSMSYPTLNDSVVIYGNDGLWNLQEKDKIINRAVEIYLAKNNRQRKVDNQAKRQRLKWGTKRHDRRAAARVRKPFRAKPKRHR